jgi:hypothetical protein
VSAYIHSFHLFRLYVITYVWHGTIILVRMYPPDMTWYVWHGTIILVCMCECIGKFYVCHTMYKLIFSCMYSTCMCMCMCTCMCMCMCMCMSDHTRTSWRVERRGTPYPGARSGQGARPRAADYPRTPRRTAQGGESSKTCNNAESSVSRRSSGRLDPKP